MIDTLGPVVITAILVPFIKWGYKKYEIKRTEKGIVARSIIYLILLELLDDLEANRVFIVVAQNNGGVPTADKPVNTSFLYERVKFREYSMIEQWQNERADHVLSRILSEMIQNTSLTIDVKDIEDSTLKDSCVSANLKRVNFYNIAMTSKKMFYLFSTWDDKEGPLTAAKKDSLRIAANKLHSLLINGKLPNRQS